MDFSFKGLGVQGAFIPNGPLTRITTGGRNVYTNAAVTGGALASNLAGLGVEAYREGREIDALQHPVPYLEGRNRAIQRLTATSSAKYVAALTNIAGRIIVPGSITVRNPAGVTYDANTAPPFVRELAARKAAIDLEMDRYLIDIQYPQIGVLKAEQSQKVTNASTKGSKIATAHLALS